MSGLESTKRSVLSNHIMSQYSVLFELMIPNLEHDLQERPPPLHCTMQHSKVLTCPRPRLRLTFSLLPAVLPHLYNPRPGTFRPRPSASPGQNKTDYQINGDRLLQGLKAASSRNIVPRISSVVSVEHLWTQDFLPIKRFVAAP